MFVQLILKDIAMIIISWDYIKTTLLIFMTDPCGVPVFIVLKVLHKMAVSVIKLIVFKLTLKK